MIKDRDNGPAPVETSLRADPAHASAILDAALDAVVTIDHYGLVLEFNSAAERTFGYSKREVLGRELAALVVPLRSASRIAGRSSAGPSSDRRRVRVLSSAAGSRFGQCADGDRVPGRARYHSWRRSRGSRVHRLHPGHQRDDSHGRAASDRRVPVPHARRAASVRLVWRRPSQSELEGLVREPPDRGGARIHPIEAVLGYTSEEWLSVVALAPAGSSRARAQGRPLVRSEHRDGRSSRPLVRAIVDLANAPELAVVAEGIEEDGQIAALRRLGCRNGQGFYFSKPLAPAAFESFVRDSRGRSAA